MYMSGNYQNLKQMSCLTIDFNFHLHLLLTVNNILANLCHDEYSKCPPVARMQARRRLRHRSVPSSTVLFSAPTNASIRFCLKSSTFCTFSGRLAALDFEMETTVPVVNAIVNSALFHSYFNSIPSKSRLDQSRRSEENCRRPFRRE